MTDGSKPLDNMRWERFCQLYAGKHHGNASRAYVEAGFKAKTVKAINVNASRALRNANISTRIDFLRKSAEGKVCLSRTDCLKVLSVAVTKADRWGDRLKAVELLSKMQGYNEPDKQDMKITGAVTVIKFEGME